MQNPINLTPITQFTALLKSAEFNQSKEIKIPIQQARLLNIALIELLDKLNRDYETLFNSLRKTNENEVINVSMDGGDFVNKD